MADNLESSIQRINDDLETTISQVERIAFGFDTITENSFQKMNQVAESINKTIGDLGKSNIKNNKSNKELLKHVTRLMSMTNILKDSAGDFQDANKEIEDSSKNALKALTSLNDAQVKSVFEFNNKMSSNLGEMDKLLFNQTKNSKNILDKQFDKIEDNIKMLDEALLDLEYAKEKKLLQNEEFSAMQSNVAIQHEQATKIMIESFQASLSAGTATIEDLEKMKEKVSSVLDVSSKKFTAGQISDSSISSLESFIQTIDAKSKILQLQKKQIEDANSLNDKIKEMIDESTSGMDDFYKALKKQQLSGVKTYDQQNDAAKKSLGGISDKLLSYSVQLDKGIITQQQFMALSQAANTEYEKIGKGIITQFDDFASSIGNVGNDYEKTQEILKSYGDMIKEQLETGLLPPELKSAFQKTEQYIEKHKKLLEESSQAAIEKQELMLNNLYGGLEGMASSIERKFGGAFGKVLFGFDPIMKTLRQRNEQILERVKKKGVITYKDIGDSMKAAAKATGNIMLKTASNIPLIMGVAFAGAMMLMANKMKGFFDDAINAAEQSWETLTSRMREGIDALRMSVSQGSAMAAALNMRFVDGLEVAWGDVAKSMAGIKDIQGDMVGLGVQQAKLVTKLSIGLGASAEAAANFYFMMKNSMGGSDKIAANAGMIVSQFSKVLGMSPEDIFKDMEESSEFLMKHTKNTGKDMVKTVMEAKKLGMKLSDVAKITESMFDYESSIQNELEASLLLGRSIDFNRARQLMFNKQTDEGMKELASMMGTYEEFQDMNFIQQQGIAKAFGMSVKEYEKVLTDQQRMNSLTNEQKKQLEAINKQREKMNDLTGEAYLNSEKAKLAQESMKQSWDDLTTDLGSQFIPIMIQYKGIMMNLMKTLLPALINGFTFLVDKIITPISDFFNSKDGQNMMSAINKEVGLIFKSLGELFDEVKGVLGELFGTSKQSIGGQASGVIETIGAGIRTVIDVMKWVVGHWKELLIAFIAMKATQGGFALYKGYKNLQDMKQQTMGTMANPMFVTVTNASQIAAAASGAQTSMTPTLGADYEEITDKRGRKHYRKKGSTKFVSKDVAFAASNVADEMAPNAAKTATKGGKFGKFMKGGGGAIAAAGTLMALSAGLEFFGPEDSKAIDAIQASLMGISTALVLIEAGQLAATAATWLWNAAMAAKIGRASCRERV